MKLSRETALLIGVPVVLVSAGVWWISHGASAEPGGPNVRFDVREVPSPALEAEFARSFPAGSDAGTGPSSRSAAPDVLTASRSDGATGAPALAVWSGVVRSRDGAPIAGATVRVRAARTLRLGDDSSLAADEWSTLTADAHGMVAFEYPSGTLLEIEARAPGFGLERFGLQGQVGQELVLDRASAVEGRVLMDGTGTPLAGATVVFENAFERYEIRTDDEGRFRFDEVAARASRLQVSDGRFVATARSVAGLQPGSGASVGDIVVQPGSLLAGEVVDGGTGPLAGAAVTLIDRVSRQEVAASVTDASGRFAFQALNPARQYAVLASGPGYRADSFGPGAGFVSLHVATTWTLGVRLAASGSTRGAKVLLKRQDGLPFAGNQPTIVAYANSSGVAAFGGLSRDVAYRVVVAHAGHAVAEFGPLTAAWNADQPLVVDLVPGATVRGTVLDASGEPVGGVTVRVQRADSFPAPPMFAIADALGNFVFDSAIAPGTVSLVTFKPGYDNSREIVDVAHGETNVALTIRSLAAFVDVP
jgi:hypothetical protein